MARVNIDNSRIKRINQLTVLIGFMDDRQWCGRHISSTWGLSSSSSSWLHQVHCITTRDIRRWQNLLSYQHMLHCQLLSMKFDMTPVTKIHQTALRSKASWDCISIPYLQLDKVKKSGGRILYIFAVIRQYYCWQHNNNNDRLTAFDPGQLG